MHTTAQPGADNRSVFERGSMTSFNPRSKARNVVAWSLAVAMAMLITGVTGG